MVVVVIRMVEAAEVLGLVVAVVLSSAGEAVEARSLAVVEVEVQSSVEEVVVVVEKTQAAIYCSSVRWPRH